MADRAAAGPAGDSTPTAPDGRVVTSADGDGPAAPGAAPLAGLSDQEVRERIEDLDRLLEYLEQAAGPVAESAVQAVGLLTQVYGTALARVMSLTGDAPQLTAALAGDEVFGHLLILHGLHPEPAQARAARAVAGIRPYLRSHGGDAELLDVSAGVARVRLSGSCQGCGASAATLQQAVADAVLGAAPELTTIEPVSSPRPVELIPAESLLRKPASAGRPGGGPRGRRARWRG